MAHGILASDGDCILGTHNGDLGENGITDSALNLLDFLNGFIVCKAVEEEIHVGRRAELLMVVLAELALVHIESFGDGQQTVDD